MGKVIDMSSAYYSISSPSTVTLNTVGSGGTITTGTTASAGSYMISGSNGTSAWNTTPYITTSVNTNPTWSGSGTASIQVKGDAEFDGDITWKGRNLGKLLEKIEDRLAILTPDSKKLEQFAALKKAYDHYKLLEKLCEVEDDTKQ
jgi:hypothetical protein